METIKPLVLEFKNGETYTLDFNKESVRFAESRGFKPEEVGDFLATKVPEFWYYAFRMHHKHLARSQTDAIFDRVGGVTSKMLERLSLLYNQALSTGLILEDEDLEKNGDVTVVF